MSPALVSLQRADGGWAQIPSLGSDAYSTGSALVALHEAGISVTSKTYRRGVQYLLKTQHADGSWRVLTRTLRTQVFFESGFPHGTHQYISAAGTNWATQALALATSSAADSKPVSDIGRISRETPRPIRERI